MFEDFYDLVCLVLDQHAWLHPAMALSRWGHVLFAALWLGQMLLFFVLPKNISPQKNLVLEMSFFLYRWAAFLSLITGINLLHIHYNFPTGNRFEGDQGKWIVSATLAATLMAVLTWRAMLPLFRKANQENDSNSWNRFLQFNTFNVYLLLPVLLGMNMASHQFYVMGGGWAGLIWGWLLSLLFTALLHIFLISFRNKKLF